MTEKRQFFYRPLCLKMIWLVFIEIDIMAAMKKNVYIALNKVWFLLKNIPSPIIFNYPYSLLKSFSPKLYYKTSEFEESDTHTETIVA